MRDARSPTINFDNESIHHQAVALSPLTPIMHTTWVHGGSVAKSPERPFVLTVGQLHVSQPHNTTPFYPGLIYFPKWLHFMWTFRKRSILGVKKKSPTKPINLSDPHCYGPRGMFSKLLKAKTAVTAELWSGRGDRCCVAGLAHVWRGSWWVSNEFLHRLTHRQPPAGASELKYRELWNLYLFNFS